MKPILEYNVGLFKIHIYNNYHNVGIVLPNVNEALPWLEKFETNIGIFGLFKIHIGNNYHDAHSKYFLTKDIATMKTMTGPVAVDCGFIVHNCSSSPSIVFQYTPDTIRGGVAITGTMDSVNMVYRTKQSNRVTE